MAQNPSNPCHARDTGLFPPLERVSIVVFMVSVLGNADATQGARIDSRLTDYLRTTSTFERHHTWPCPPHSCARNSAKS